MIDRETGGKEVLLGIGLRLDALVTFSQVESAGCAIAVEIEQRTNWACQG